MKNFFIALVIVIALGAGAYYYMLDSGKIELPKPEVVYRTPADYHVLEGLGGVPMDEAVLAGLATAEYAYLRSMKPIQSAKAIEIPQRVSLGGKPYDLAYKFNSERGQDQVLEFNLLRGWDELHFGFGFDDDEGSDPHEKWAIEFTVKVDGETVIGPTQIAPVSKPVFAKAVVTGANRVTFISKRIGSSNPFAPILVDPFVVKLDQQ